MKDKLIYIIIFVAAFLAVTGGIYYLNSSYNNIFAFDFTATASEGIPEMDGRDSSDSLKVVKLNSVIDSLKLISQMPDTVHIETIVDTSLIDSIKKLEDRLNNIALKEQEVKKTEEIDSLTAVKKEIAGTGNAKDSTYKVWVKKTVSLYEAMDAKKAAKIIETYSDNVAKDILFSMKKKKAADILSQFSPEAVNRITRTQ